jgi:hypothetical protein
MSRGLSPLLATLTVDSGRLPPSSLDDLRTVGTRGAQPIDQRTAPAIDLPHRPNVGGRVARLLPASSVELLKLVELAQEVTNIQVVVGSAKSS